MMSTEFETVNANQSEHFLFDLQTAVHPKAKAQAKAKAV